MLIQTLLIIDDYLKLILTSWPAVILILSIFILLRHKKAINDRIQNIKSVGREGISMYPSGAKSVTIPKPEREPSKSLIDIIRDIFASLFHKTTSSKEKVALVECKIASSLPGTVVFDFLRDWKVWFWIVNREPKKYKAYVKIKFITDEYEKELNESYYGGVTPWNLNAFSAIMAPGLGIPNEIKEATGQRKKIKIEINCTVKDENDELVENKLPSVYAYEYESKTWYLEP